MKDIVFPLRINKYLALRGITTRKGADKLIEAGLVFLNKQRVKLGAIVHERDSVEIKKTPQVNKYMAFYKPQGLSMETIIVGKKKEGLFPIGRLDKESEGLIILTNDGRLTDRMLNPIYDHEKEYVIEVKEKLRPGIVKIFEKGMILGGVNLKPAKTKIENNHALRVILREGKKHQLRRMLNALRYTVSSLKRVRMHSIRLENLRPGSERELKGKELTTLLSSLDLPI